MASSASEKVSFPPGTGEAVTLSVIIPCYNERSTLSRIVERVLAVQNEQLKMELIIVDDCSTDGSFALAESLRQRHPEIKLIQHPRNRGKGAALHTGIDICEGDIVCINDADEEYSPSDLPRLIKPILEGKADVVYGSRFRKDEPRRVLYFWHSLMNRTLTLVSNMFTDMDLTDMETCYKVFRQDVIKSLDLKEERFGFEPEVTVKTANKGYRVYEMGISYSPRTYEEGKKISWKDGIHALYCIFHYGAAFAPIPIQLLIYLFIGGVAGLCNITFFLLLNQPPFSVPAAAGTAYILAAAVNYLLCITLLFRHKARFDTIGEILAYVLIVALSGLADVAMTTALMRAGIGGLWAKASASALVLIINFLGRKYFVFKEHRM